MPQFFVLSGTQRQPITLETPAIGSGGEADIFSVPTFTGSAAKIYHGRLGPKRDARDKLLAMLAKPPEHLSVKVRGQTFPLFAWPTHIIEDDQGHCVGFLMPKVSLTNTVKLGKYLWRDLMRQSLSLDDCSLPRRVQVCRNLAAAIAEIHRQEHFFVDLKPDNIYMFKDTGIVCMVDNDSYSIAPTTTSPRFPGTVFTSQYQAPELLRNGMPASSVVNDTQDRFALAVMIFQLFNYGQHPFQGVPTSALEEWNVDFNVKAGYYPHGRTPHPAIRPMPMSVHDCMDDKTLDLFNRAFTGLPSQRPSAAEWRDHLDQLQAKTSSAFVRCDQQPNTVTHIHFAGKPCPECRMDGLDDSAPTAGSAPVLVATTFAQPSSGPGPVKGGNRWLIWIVLAAAAAIAYAVVTQGPGNRPAAAEPATAPTGAAPPNSRSPAPPPAAAPQAPVFVPPTANAPSPTTPPRSEPVPTETKESPAFTSIARGLTSPDDLEGTNARLKVISQAMAEAAEQNQSELQLLLRLGDAGNDQETQEAAKVRMLNHGFLHHYEGWQRFGEASRDITEELALRTDYRAVISTAQSRQSRALALNPLDRESAGNLAFFLALGGKDGVARDLAIYALSLPRPAGYTGRSADWQLLAAMYARQGKLNESRSAYMVALALSSKLNGFCKSVLVQQADFGESLKGPIEAAFKRIADRGQSGTESCAYPPQWRQ